MDRVRELNGIRLDGGEGHLYGHSRKWRGYEYMAGDFQFEKGASFGEWLHAQLHDAVAFESEAWALDRVRRVEDRLQAGRPDTHRLITEIPWMEVVTAFTSPGRYIYFTRSLYQLCATDPEVAMVIAHEMAHHNLGHVNSFASWAPKIIHLPGAKVFAYALLTMEKRLYGPKRECDADRHGLDLCIQAGYNERECLKLFDVLEGYASDIEDPDAVYGPDLSEIEKGTFANWKAKAELWTWEHTHGYLPIVDRREMLQKYLRENGNLQTKVNHG